MSDAAVPLSYVDYDWGLRVEECPCDVQFVDWLDENQITGAAIYHFGTGSHHYVGVECAKPERRNSVFGITAAPQEIESFIKLTIDRPDVLRYYNCLFGDIYLLNGKLLPTFDVVTLFHLCEFRSWQHDAYGAMTDLDVTRLLSGRTKPGGHILFYQGSLAFDWPETGARHLIAQWEREADFERVGTFKTLLVYRKRG